MVSEAAKARRAARKTARFEKYAAADEDYTAQAAKLKQLLSRTQTDYGLAAGKQAIDFGAAQTELGFNPTTQSFDLGNKRKGLGQAQDMLRNNFAGRGMLRSSGYVGDSANTATQYNDQLTKINVANKDFQDQQALDLSRAATDTEEARIQARNDAVKRRQARIAAGL